MIIKKEELDSKPRDSAKNLSVLNLIINLNKKAPNRGDLSIKT